MNDADSTKKDKHKLARGTQHNLKNVCQCHWIWQFYSQISSIAAGHDLFMWNVNQGIHSKVTPSNVHRQKVEFSITDLLANVLVERFISLDHLCSNKWKWKSNVSLSVCGLVKKEKKTLTGVIWMSKQERNKFKGKNDIKMMNRQSEKSSPSHVLRTSDKPGDIPGLLVNMAWSYQWNRHACHVFVSLGRGTEKHHRLHTRKHS